MVVRLRVKLNVIKYFDCGEQNKTLSVPRPKVQHLHKIFSI